MNTTKLKYIVIWQAFEARSEVVSRHRTLDAAERECAKLQYKYSSNWPKPTERRYGGYAVTHSEL